MSDWADEKAQEWVDAWFVSVEYPEQEHQSLAALLRGVVKQKQYEQWQEDQHVTAEELSKRMAEVRRVVEEVRKDYESGSLSASDLWSSGRKACDEILFGLEQLR